MCWGRNTHSRPSLGKAAVSGCSLVSRMCVPEDILNMRGSGIVPLSSLLLTTNKIQWLSGRDTFNESFQMKARQIASPAGSTFKWSHVLYLQFELTVSFILFCTVVKLRDHFNLFLFYLVTSISLHLQVSSTHPLQYYLFVFHIIIVLVWTILPLVLKLLWCFSLALLHYYYYYYYM